MHAIADPQFTCQQAHQGAHHQSSASLALQHAALAGSLHARSSPRLVNSRRAGTPQHPAKPQQAWILDLEHRSMDALQRAASGLRAHGSG